MHRQGNSGSRSRDYRLLDLYYSDVEMKPLFPHIRKHGYITSIDEWKERVKYAKKDSKTKKTKERIDSGKGLSVNAAQRRAQPYSTSWYLLLGLSVYAFPCMVEFSHEHRRWKRHGQLTAHSWDRCMVNRRITADLLNWRLHWRGKQRKYIEISLKCG